MSEGIQLECFVRSLAPRGGRHRQARVFERLEALAARGTVEDYHVHVTGRRIPASRAAMTTEFGAFLLDRIELFEDWAGQTDRSLDGVFERRSVDSRITGEAYEAVVMPLAAVAEYREDDLQFVAPSTGPEGTTDVRDRLATLLEPSDADEGIESPDEQTRRIERRLDRQRATRVHDYASNDTNDRQDDEGALDRRTLQH